ncbi:hypothetical protein WJX82_008536 [Trebouxia sp. C0006]
MFALAVFNAHQRSSELSSVPEQGVIFSTLSGREPTLLARVHPRSSLTSWVGPEALPDVLAGQSSPGVMLRISDDLHAHSDDFQSKSTAMAVSSGVLEVVPTLSASTLGRFQPPDLDWRQACTTEADFTNSSPKIVPRKPRHQHNGISKGSNSTAKDNIPPASTHCPDVVFVSNVTSDITTGLVATPTLTPGVLVTVPKAPCHQHNGISTGSTPQNITINNTSWVSTSTCSGFDFNIIIAALPAVELCMMEGSSTEVHAFACHLHCGVPRATKPLDGSQITAFVLLTVHNASDSWAGSFLAAPEAILRLLLAASFDSQGFPEIHVPGLTSHMHSGAPLAVHLNHTLTMLLRLSDAMPCNRNTIESINIKRAPFALGFLPTGMYLVVQGLICHMHSGAPKTILFATLNSIGGNCSQMMPGVVNTLAAPHGTCNILHDSPDVWMQEEDATTSLWVIALFISISLHVLLLLFQKSVCFSCISGPRVDWTTGVYRGSEIGTCRRVLKAT